MSSYDTGYEHSLEHYVAVKTMVAKSELSGAAAVSGIYRDLGAADQAIVALREAGFRNTDISVLFSKNEGTKDFACEKQTKAPEGTVPEATSVAKVGGGLSWQEPESLPLSDWVC